MLELVVAIYVNVRELPIEIPTYTLENSHFFWYDLNTDFGTLHLPNDTYRQKKTCFDVIYKSNSEGFRDIERPIKSGVKRVVALGDSFIEGYGVNPEHRLTNLLEDDTKSPHLNFGLAGNFGPTQYYVLYKSLASKYNHDAVLIGILPSNDFIDDDYEINLTYGGYRYRPFFKGNYPDYELVYNLNRIEMSKARPRTVGFKSRLLKNFSYTYTLYNYIRAKSYIAKLSDTERLEKNKIPSYSNYTTQQFHRLKYALEQIKKASEGKKIMVFTIPIFKEIVAYRETNKNPLGQDLNKVCGDLGIDYLDLLPETNALSLEACEALFLPCDGHWSKKGSLFALEAIKNKFSYYSGIDE